jgi:hypothetical protein
VLRILADCDKVSGVVYFVEGDAVLKSSIMIAQNEKGAGSWEVRDLLTALVYIVQ